ncbi:hypothetical protein [Lysinibacillus sp. NPDC056185]|uniref:hypothetical protein n=1 Tax=Lysinibacillus sp. NPDC056185 TaxID=3345739 RepID=UPI0039F0441D
MRIYGVNPVENEAAEFENALYINLAIDEINKSNEWLKTSDKSYQVMLAHIEILLMLARRFPGNANVLIKKFQTKEWKETFNEWFNRCEKKYHLNIEKALKLMLMNSLLNWRNTVIIYVINAITNKIVLLKFIDGRGTS